jgi:hypothetical protein
MRAHRLNFNDQFHINQEIVVAASCEIAPKLPLGWLHTEISRMSDIKPHFLIKWSINKREVLLCSDAAMHDWVCIIMQSFVCTRLFKSSNQWMQQISSQISLYNDATVNIWVCSKWWFVYV